jgi:hypothetical protein
MRTVRISRSEAKKARYVPKSPSKEGSAESAPTNRRQPGMGKITLKLMAYIFFTVNDVGLPEQRPLEVTVSKFLDFSEILEKREEGKLSKQRSPRGGTNFPLVPFFF